MYKFITKEDLDEIFVNNARYKSWESKNEKRELASLSFGFKVMNPTMRRRYKKQYWMYEIPNDFDIEPSCIELVPSLDSLEPTIRAHLVKKYGDEYLNALKLHLRERYKNDDNKYEYKLEQVQRFLKSIKQEESEN